MTGHKSYSGLTSKASLISVIPGKVLSDVGSMSTTWEDQDNISSDI